MELSNCGSFIYIGVLLLVEHVFTSLLGGVPLCIP